MPESVATPQLPARARVVVIGGGIIGTSVAYHLGHLGWTDTVLVERDRLTSGTTWHAAGLMVTFGSMSETSTGLRRYTRDLYSRLEAETGQATGFAPIGFIELASGADRVEEFRRVAAFNRHCGVEVHELTPAEVVERFPLVDPRGVDAGFYVPGDGRVNPVDATMALARGARQQGVRIVQGVSVERVETERGRVTGVRTNAGVIECEYVVNCAGMWARQLGERNGVNIPLQAAEHYYLITEPMQIGADWPVVEDPAHYAYYREETGGMMIGLFEPVCAPWKVDGVPADSSFTTIVPDWDRMGPYVEHAMARVPAAMDAGVRTFFCGPESFTPDLAPIVGEAPEIANYFVAAGLNSIGILTGGGIGKVVAEWIVDGRPNVDVTGMNIDRLQPYQATAAYRRERTVEALGMVYACHYPNRAMHTGRGAKRSALHERLSAQGAQFRDVSGWESADWYAGFGATPDPGPLTWGRPAWWAQWEAEHRACRDGVIVMDMSFMSKFRVRGPGAAVTLEQLSANRVTGEDGRITYTQWLNDAGRIEADLTVAQLRGDDLWVVASDTAHRHVLARLHRFAQPGAQIEDVTAAYAQLNVQGPRSRAVLEAVSGTDLSNEAFPYRSVAWIEIGLASVLCVRITYLGELGYELYVPTEQAVQVYDAVVAAGEPHGLRHAGLKALASLRMEKGYRDYGHDIDNTDDVDEAGLGFAVALDKPGGFIGRDALARRRAERDGRAPSRRLCSVQLTDPDPLLHHGEVVWGDGADAGYVRAASYGHTLGGAVGLAMVDLGEPVTQAALDRRAWEVDVAGRRWPAKLSIRAPYDPANARVTEHRA